jgi:alanyl-tRNA synthetase
VSQPRPITAAELAQVEADVNAQIRANTAVSTRLMTPQAAVEEGAMALFGEKYGDEVRVVSMGTVLDGGGGAVTGQSALTQIAESESRLAEIAQALKTSPAEAPARVAALVEDRRRLERQLADLQTKLALAAADGAIEQIGGVALIARNLGEVPPRELKTIADALRKQLGSGIVALVSTAEGKASLIVAVSHDLAGTYDAVGLVRAGSAVVGGKGGGGKPDLAQAGGPDGARADEALDAIRAALAG